MRSVEKQTRLDCTQLHQSSVVGRTLKVSLSLHDSIMRAIRTVQLETILSRWDMSHSCQPMWKVHISECGYTYIQYIHTYPNSSLEMCWPNVFHHGHFPRFNQLNCLTDGYILPRDKQATMLCSIQWCFCVVWSMVVSLLCYSTSLSMRYRSRWLNQCCSCFLTRTVREKTPKIHDFCKSPYHKRANTNANIKLQQ